MVCSAFFALNMGGAGFSPAFSAALGAKLVSRTWAHILFGICVGVGALLIGGHVATRVDVVDDRVRARLARPRAREPQHAHAHARGVAGMAVDPADSLYPLRGWNYRLYEHLTKHEWKLRMPTVVTARKNSR